MNQMGMSEEQLLAASQLYAPSTKGPLITEIQKLMNEMNLDKIALNEYGINLNEVKKWNEMNLKIKWDEMKMK